MKHDDLLYGIKEIERLAEGMYGTRALRAVVELHKPTPEPVFVSELECKVCDSAYPCPTIQAIQKEFGINE